MSTSSGTPTPKRVGEWLRGAEKWLWATVPRRIATLVTSISVVAGLITIFKFVFYERSLLEYEKAFRIHLPLSCTAVVSGPSSSGFKYKISINFDATLKTKSSDYRVSGWCVEAWGGSPEGNVDKKGYFYIALDEAEPPSDTTLKRLKNVCRPNPEPWPLGNGHLQTDVPAKLRSPLAGILEGSSGTLFVMLWVGVESPGGGLELEERTAQCPLPDPNDGIFQRVPAASSDPPSAAPPAASPPQPSSSAAWPQTFPYYTLDEIGVDIKDPKNREAARAFCVQSCDRHPDLRACAERCATEYLFCTRKCGTADPSPCLRECGEALKAKVLGIGTPGNP